MMRVIQGAMVCLFVAVFAAGGAWGKGSVVGARGKIVGARGGVVEIHTALDLDLVRAGLSGSYRLMADIDLGGVVFAPIGNAAAAFTGVFDGNGHTITGAAYDGAAGFESEIGFFGRMEGAIVRDLVLVDVEMSAFTRVGGLAGMVAGGSVVSGCSVSGVVSGFIDETGGFVGQGWASAFTDCRADVLVVDLFGAGFRVGGFVGHAHEGSTFTGCSATGDVAGKDCVGGFVGVLHGASAADCEASGAVEGFAWVGGFAGYFKFEAGFDTYTERCAATGDELVVSTGFSTRLFHPQGTGGFAGLIEFDTWVTDCYATRDVFGFVPTVESAQQSSVGGLIGYTEVGSVVRGCFAMGDVVGNGAGGAVGWCEGQMIDVHASGDVWGTGFCGGLLGSAQRVNRARTESGVVRGCSASGDVFATGKLNGHATPGHDFGAVGGLIGYMFPGSRAYGSHASGNTEGEGEFVGGLVGFFWDNEIERCYALGDVTGHGQKAGGLIGGVREAEGADGIYIQISDCYAWGDVHTAANTSAFQKHYGGLIGGVEGDFNGRGLIERCYSIGRVPKRGIGVGGLIGGLPNGSPSNVRYEGLVWDVVTSETKRSAQGAGLKTPAMQSESTYTALGWDFENVWEMDPVSGYPVLRAAKK